MITHYGLFWSERNVFWGRRNNAGQLLGRERSQLTRRGAPTATERRNARNYGDYVGLYCLYGDGELIYVGEAGLGTNSTLLNRLRQHRNGPLADRWDSFSWFGRSACEGKTKVQKSLAQLEAIVVAIINPGFNKQHGTFKGAQQVFQVPHDEAEGNIDTKLARLEKQIEKLGT